MGRTSRTLCRIYFALSPILRIVAYELSLLCIKVSWMIPCLRPLSESAARSLIRRYLLLSTEDALICSGSAWRWMRRLDHWSRNCECYTSSNPLTMSLRLILLERYEQVGRKGSCAILRWPD